MLEKLIQGGPLMIPLVVCSILTLAVVIDRFAAFYKNSRIDTRALRARIMELLMQCRLAEAAVLCASTPGPVSAVLLTGLQAYNKLKKMQDSPDSLRHGTEKAMNDYSLHAMSAVEKRLNVLSTVGNAAPLIGMAGTVTGMIKSFNVMAASAGLDASSVSTGISEALITTAAGLLIALAAVIPYNIFTSMADNIELEIEEATTELLESISTFRDRL